MNMTMKLVVIFAVLAAATGIVVLRSSEKTTPERASMAAPSTAEAQPEVSEAPPVDQTQSIPAVLPQLVDLGANKCIPCKAMAPILEALREDFVGQFDVVFIDVWEDRAAGEVYGIKMIPTQIFIDAKGQELFRHEGFYSREEILAKWSELGVQIEVPATTEAGT